MRTPVKIIMSLVAIIATIWGYGFMVSLGQVWPSYAVIFLGIAGVAMTWIFPEVVTRAGGRR